jgi:hypothetical protein
MYSPRSRCRIFVYAISCSVSWKLVMWLIQKLARILPWTAPGYVETLSYDDRTTHPHPPTTSSPIATSMTFVTGQGMRPPQARKRKKKRQGRASLSATAGSNRTSGLP